ncbi:MAG: hypothetical protein LWY06_14220 [Firmicutes bacterium]|nr:hypothetical protein [Bacillota bacterium]
MKDLKKVFGDNWIHKEGKITKLVCKEKNSSYTFINNGKYHIVSYKVDEGLVSEGKRCDYLFGLNEPEMIYFIELKGCDLNNAALQLSETIKRFSHKISGWKLNARAVVSKVSYPGVMPSQVLRLKRELASRGGNFEIKCKSLIEEAK